MLPPIDNLAELYTEPALRVLLETTYEGFHALVYRASQNADLPFLERALGILEPEQLKVDIRFSLLGSTLSFTTGAGDGNYLKTESLFGSFLRGLRGREFGARETRFLDALLLKAVVGNQKVTTPDLYGDALTRLMNVGAAGSAHEHMIDLGANAFNKPSATPIQAAGRELYANGLGMAIITGNEKTFEYMIAKAFHSKSGEEAAKFWTDQIAIQIDPANKHTEQTFTALDTILLYAPPEQGPGFLRICHASSQMTTPLIDGILEKYLKRARGTEKKAIEYADHWSRPLNTAEWNEDTVNTVLSYRDSTVAFSSPLLYESMQRACYPVLEAALQAGQSDFSKVYRESNRYSPINCAKTVASSGAPPERISRSLAAIIAGGADVNQYSDDTTALIDAAKNGRLDVAGVLLQHGADPSATDSRNWKAASSFKDRAQRAKFEQMVNSVKAQKSVESVLKAKLGHIS